MIRSLFLLLGLVVAQAAGAVQVGGVDLPNRATVAGQPLVLNGAGVRHRFVFKVYAAGLYLPAKAGATEQVLAMPGAKRIHIHMLRDIDGNTLGKLFTRGMEDNSTRAEFARAIPGTIQLSELFVTKKSLKAGESFSVDFRPGTGTQIMVNGEDLGKPIAEPEFFSAMLRIWLGPKPADDLLKDQLLGHKPPESPPGQQVN